MSKFFKPGAVAGAMLGMMIGAAASWAADASVPLAARIGRDEAQMQKLENRVTRARGVQIAQIFGESDEEKAARQQHEDNQDSSIAQLNQRVNDLEDSLRRLTGQIEELDHRLDQTDQHITQMQKDFDYKLCTMAAQQLGTSSGDQDALPCSGQQQGQPQSTITGAVAPPDSSAATIHLSPPPGILGTMPAGSQQTPSVPVQTASIDTRKKFDAAMNLLAKAQYDEAGAAFRNFADTYPQDDLAPQAVYWVGDIAYVQKDYPGAARAFVEEIKKYPTSPRSPDSMLKLGQALIAMNQTKEGCTTLAAIPSKYPSASQSVVDRAKAARKESCH